jgi:hypothetical protein
MIAIVVIVLALFGIGGLYAFNQSSKTENANTPTNQAPNPTPSTPNPTTTPPVTPPATTPTSTEGGDITTPTSTVSIWEKYTRATEYFLKYPPYLVLQTGSDLAGGFFDIGSTQVKLRFPQDYFKKDNSNFVESYLVVSRNTIDTDRLASSQCTSFSDIDNKMNDKAAKKVINGVSWYMQHVEEPAAGNRYYSDIYRTVRDNYCYEVAITVHTGVKENYEPMVHEFNKTKAINVLEKVLGTFTFFK